MEQATNDWILFMDADERLTDALKNEIVRTINSEGNAPVAYLIFAHFYVQKQKTAVQWLAK